MTNAEILNLIRTTSSEEYQTRIPSATKDNLNEVQDQILNYPNAKNEFISVLTNQVAKTIFFNKLYNNPFKFFKKGTLPYGKSIESIFVDLVKGKGWNENFGTANTEVSSLIGKESWNDTIKVEYYSENFRNKYKITVTEDQLRGAFRNPQGLSELMQMLLQSPLNSAEFDEFLMVKKVISQLTVKETVLTGFDTLDKKSKAEELTETIRATVDDMRFMTDAYNTGGVHTFSKPSDLVILVTPRTKAMLDVQLLAQSFNMDKADVSARVVLIDNFFKPVTDSSSPTEEDTDTLALICDKNLVQFYETQNTSAQFFNPDRLETNIFYHRWGIMAGCSWVNALKIKKEAVAP